MSFALSAYSNNNYQAIAIAGNPSQFGQGVTNNYNYDINFLLNINCCQHQPPQNDLLDLLFGLDNLTNTNNNGYHNLQNIVAPNETGTVTGDPHFRGGDGDIYDVQGVPGKVYDLLDDTNLNYNGKFEAWGNGGATVVSESAINVAGFGSDSFSSVSFNKSGVAKVNGHELQNGETVVLADGGTATKQGNVLTVKTAEGYTIKQTAMAGGYINSEVKTSALGVATDNRLPGGLLGQTFDPDHIAKRGTGNQGQGVIAGKVSDYETSLNKCGNVKLDANGRPIVERDPFLDFVNWLCQLLNPSPNRDFLDTLSFVMSNIFAAMGAQNNQQY